MALAFEHVGLIANLALHDTSPEPLAPRPAHGQLGAHHFERAAMGKVWQQYTIGMVVGADRDNGDLSVGTCRQKLCSQIDLRLIDDPH